MAHPQFLMLKYKICTKKIFGTYNKIPSLANKNYEMGYCKAKTFLCLQIGWVGQKMAKYMGSSINADFYSFRNIKILHKTALHEDFSILSIQY